MTYVLDVPASDEDWRAFHAIREAELFEARGRYGVYDRNHPDDRLPENTPLLLKLHGMPVGVVRIDNRGDGTGVIRLVAVAAAEQRRGHGRVLSRMSEARAAEMGISTLYVNAAPQALDYYRKMGWRAYDWDPAELVGVAADCIQMRKQVGGRAG